MKKKIYCFITSVILLFVVFSICSAQQSTTPITQTVETANVPVAVNATVSPSSEKSPVNCANLDVDEYERAKFLSKKTKEEAKEIVQQCEKNKIRTVPMLLSYRTVRDNFGKRIGNSFVVVQVNIQNNSSKNQFYVTDLQVWLDPNQCNKAAEFYKDIKFKPPETPNAEQVAAFQANPKITACLYKFDEYFQYPIALEPIQSERVIGVGTAAQYRSKRKIGFQALNFIANLSSAFTGLGFLGRDGIKAFGFLGSTIIPSADTAIPNISNGKMENLKNASERETIVVKPNSSKVVNIFIETDSFFSQDTWKYYKASLKKTDAKALEFRRLLKLFTVSSVDGILISDDTEKVTITSPGVVPTASNN
jgi:hypothetical protein